MTLVGTCSNTAVVGSNDSRVEHSLFRSSLVVLISVKGIVSSEGYMVNTDQIDYIIYMIYIVFYIRTASFFLFPDQGSPGEMCIRDRM